MKRCRAFLPAAANGPDSLCSVSPRTSGGRLSFVRISACRRAVKAPQRCNTLRGFHFVQWAVRDSNL